MTDNRASYTVTVAGIEHTFLLDNADAARYGRNAVKVGERKATPVKTEPEPEPEVTETPAARAKARAKTGRA